MYTDRLRRILIPSLALFVLTLLLVIVGTIAAGAAGAAPRHEALSELAATVQTRDAIVEFGDPVFLAEDEQTKSVVAFGGDITVAGTVTESVVAFGGDVRLLPTARVGADVAATDPSVVSLGGTVTVENGAQVNGQVEHYSEGSWPWAAMAAAPEIQNTPWSGFSFIGWLVQTALFLILGLIAAALLPKQLLAVGRSLSAAPAASLGWGALGFFIVVPVAAVILIISIIGLLVVLPGLVVVPLFYFFVTLAVAVYLVQRLMARTAHAENLMFVTALGVVGTTIISRIPVAGDLALLAATVFGTGAAYLAVLQWRRGRKALAAPLPPSPLGGPAPSTDAGPGPAPAGAPAPLLPSAGASTPLPSYPAPSPAASAEAISTGIAPVTALTPVAAAAPPTEQNTTAAMAVVPAAETGEASAVAPAPPAESPEADAVASPLAAETDALAAEPAAETAAEEPAGAVPTPPPPDAPNAGGVGGAQGS